MGNIDRSWIEINLDNLTYNVQTLHGVLPPKCRIMAVVKANAYGHGDVEVARHLNKIGINTFAVATIGEGIHLREHGVTGEILVLGYTVPQRIPELVHYNLSQTVVGLEHAKQIDDFGTPARVHIKVDTGMHRLGESYEHVSGIAQMFEYKNLKIEGIFTHLCVADSLDVGDVKFTEGQIQSFYQLLVQLRSRHIVIPKIHIQSSYGILNYPELQCDYVRPGVALYGILSSPGDVTNLQLPLQSVLALKTRVAQVRGIETGESVGYGRQFVAHTNTKIAVLPIGYADGLPRNLSCGDNYVLIHGHRAPIIGRICMDQMMVDVTEIPSVKNGDIATIIGRDGKEEISAEQVAKNAGTITNELLSRLGSRLERIPC